MMDIATDRPDLPGHVEESVRALAELHAEHHRGAPPLQRLVDRSVRLIARPRFAALMTIAIALWILINLALGQWDRAFDGPPFAILQGIVQFAAFYISVLILITQHHKSELIDHREQLTLELVMLSEQKNAKIVDLIEEMRRDNPMIRDRIDPYAEAMAVPADPHQVLHAIKETHGQMLASVDAEIADRVRPVPVQPVTADR